MRAVATVTLIVPSYEEGIAFFCGALGFRLLEDIDQGRKRWVVVAPGEGLCGAHLLLSEPSDNAQRAAMGNQAGGRVGFFLETDDFERDHTAMKAAGAVFLEAPRDEPYGRVAKWRDPFGNLWDLLEPKR